MGVLAYIPCGVENSPYKKLLDPLLWTEICDVFMKDACALLGFSVESPLSVWYVSDFKNLVVFNSFMVFCLYFLKHKCWLCRIPFLVEY